MSQDYRCGHNYFPAECPHPRCGYRDALARVAELEAEVERLKAEISVKDDDFHKERKALLSLLDDANAEIERLMSDKVGLQSELMVLREFLAKLPPDAKAQATVHP